MRNVRRTALLLALALPGATLACDERTAEEKGKDYANEKLGFVEGAAGVLKEKGAQLGQMTAQGVADTVKGMGAGVKDVMYPPVKLELSPSALDSGVSVQRANEADSDAEGRVVEAQLAFAAAFRGGLVIHPLDAAGVDLGMGTLDKQLDLPVGSVETLRFQFPKSVRFSQVKTFRLDAEPPLDLTPHASAAQLMLSQFSRKGQIVALYVQFSEKFKGALELRAYAADGTELGRSSKLDKLDQSADSAAFFEFAFDARAPLHRVTKYELRKL